MSRLRVGPEPNRGAGNAQTVTPTVTPRGLTPAHLPSPPLTQDTGKTPGATESRVLSAPLLRVRFPAPPPASALNQSPFFLATHPATQSGGRPAPPGHDTIRPATLVARPGRSR